MEAGARIVDGRSRFFGRRPDSTWGRVLPLHERVVLSEATSGPLTDASKPALVDLGRMDPGERDLWYKKILMSRPGLIRIEENRSNRFLAEGRSNDLVEERRKRYIEELNFARRMTGRVPSMAQARTEVLSVVEIPPSLLPRQVITEPDNNQPDTAELLDQPKGASRWSTWTRTIIRPGFLWRRSVTSTTTAGGISRRERAGTALLVAGALLAAGLLGSWSNDWGQSAQGKDSSIVHTAGWIKDHTFLKSVWPEPIAKVKKIKVRSVVEKRVEVPIPTTPVTTLSGEVLNVSRPEARLFTPPLVEDQVGRLGDLPSLERPISVAQSTEQKLTNTRRKYFPTADMVVGPDSSSVIGNAEAVWFQLVTGRKINLDDLEQKQIDMKEYWAKRAQISTSYMEIAAIDRDIVIKTNLYYQGLGYTHGPFFDYNPDLVSHFSKINSKSAIDRGVCSHSLATKALRDLGCVANVLVIPNQIEAKQIVDEVRRFAPVA